MKNIITLILSVSLVISLAACSGNKNSSNDTDSTTKSDDNTQITTVPTDTNNDPEIELQNRLKSLLYLCDELGAFDTPDDISGISFFFAARYDVGHIKEEHYYHEYDENKEFPHPIYTYDITKFDAYSLRLFDTTFEYAALEDGSYSFYEYTYNGEQQLLIEKITGFGGGPDDITFNIVYEGYEVIDGKYVVSASFTAEDLMGNKWDTDITSVMTAEIVDGVYKVRSYVINGDFSQAINPPKNA